MQIRTRHPVAAAASSTTTFRGIFVTRSFSDGKEFFMSSASSRYLSVSKFRMVLKISPSPPDAWHKFPYHKSEAFSKVESIACAHDACIHKSKRCKMKLECMYLGCVRFLLYYRQPTLDGTFDFWRKKISKSQTPSTLPMNTNWVFRAAFETWKLFCVGCRKYHPVHELPIYWNSTDTRY